MFKRYLLAVASIIVLSSCSVTNYTYRDVQVNKKNIITDDVVVDVKVDITKPIKSISSKRNSEDDARNEAYFKAITENNIDLVIDPIFEVSTSNKFLFFGGKSIVKLSGFAGYYSNPRNKRDVVKELQNLKLQDVVSFEKLYFPNFVQTTKVKSNVLSSVKFPYFKILKSGVVSAPPVKENLSVLKNLSFSVYSSTNTLNSDFKNNGFAIGSSYDFNPNKKIGFKVDGIYSKNDEYDHIMKSLNLRYTFFDKLRVFAGPTVIHFFGDSNSFFNDFSFGYCAGFSYNAGRNLVVESKFYDFSNVGSSGFDISYNSILIGIGYRF
jgi:hypothetical protein